MAIGSAIKCWRMIINVDTAMAVKGKRLQCLLAHRILRWWIQMWRDTIARNRQRSLEFERARCRVNRCILQVQL